MLRSLYYFDNEIDFSLVKANFRNCFKFDQNKYGTEWNLKEQVQ